FESKGEIIPGKRVFRVAGGSQIAYMNRSTESLAETTFGRQQRRRQTRGAHALGYPARVDHGRDETLVSRLRHERDRGGRASRTCWSTARAVSRSAWRPTSRRTIWAKWSMPAWR